MVVAVAVTIGGPGGLEVSMSVVLSLAGAPPSRVAVGSSPLAELTAALHAYTEAEHHPRAIHWARGLETHGTAPDPDAAPALHSEVPQRV
ncbi:DUF5937 family protein, partial [Streptomyces brasiliscabiei]|uniref:DUF5937 family protein n=1 Tax=Streptomyces brasiliscabiei TaxID=2736302 RepID=UPI001F2CFCB4